MTDSSDLDGRRLAGLRTQARLLEAALDLIAAGGEGGLSLRGVTGAADANIAAVRYHFGSLKSLSEAAIEAALERYLAAQEAEVDALGPGATVEELAAAFARPMVRAMAAGGRELAVMRIVARSGLEPPPGWARFDASFLRIRVRSVEVLKANLIGAKERDLVFRTRSAAGLMNWLVIAPVGAELRGRSEKQIEALLVPTLVGTFRGS